MHIRTFRSKKLHPDHVKILNEAIRHNAKGKQKDVHITYKKENGELSDRKVRPLAVKGKSLFVAHCYNKDAIRSFRVERIQTVKEASTAMSRRIARLIERKTPKQLSHDCFYQSLREATKDSDRCEHIKNELTKAIKTVGCMEKAGFWAGFEKKAEEIDPNEYLKTLHDAGKSWESSGKKKRWAYLGIPAAIAGGVMAKRPLARAGLALAGIGSGLVGYGGERQMGYGHGLQTISNHLSGKPTSQQDWDHLVMNNPSGSLMTHVHPAHRAALAKKWSEEYKRFHKIPQEKP